MNLELPSTYEDWQKSLTELNKYLSPVEKKETHDVEFYKELARKLREYGIDKIRADINKRIEMETKKGLKQTEKFTFAWKTLTRTTYTTFIPLEFPIIINGEKFDINFCNQKSFIKGPNEDRNFMEYDRSENQARHDEINGNIYVNISNCESLFKYAKELMKIYGCVSTVDIYDFLSSAIVHEMEHRNAAKNNYRRSILMEEANIEVKFIDALWEPALLTNLDDVYIAVIDEDITAWLGRTYKFTPRNSPDYEEKYKRYIQAFKNVLKDSGKEVEFDRAKKIILDNVKTSYTELNGKKTEKYITRNGKKMRQGHYYINGERNEWGYIVDLHKAFAPVLTPDILQKIIAEYKRLSKVK